MKKILSIILATAQIALHAASDIPQTPTDWYTPPNYKPPSIMQAEAEIRDQRGELHDVMFELAVDDDGNIIDSSLEYALTDIKLSVNSAIDLLDGAIRDIAQNKLDIALNNERFKTLGDNLHKVINTKGLTITSPTPDGSTHSFTINFQNGIGNDNTIQGTTTAFGFPTHDDKSLGLLKGNKYEIKGWNNKKSIQTLAVAEGDIPFRTKEGAELEYRQWRGFDMSSIGYNDADQFEIKGWDKAKACDANLTKMLTDPADNNRTQHLLLSKAGKDLHYLPIGDVINTNSAPVVVDEKSITKVTETSEDGEETTKLALMGFDESPATEGIDASSVFPYKASNKLAWSPFFSFFSDGIFKKNSKNKISLKGLDTISEGTKIVTASGNGGEPQLGASDLKDMIDKPLAVENKKITIEGWSGNKDGNLFDASGCEVVVRDNGKVKFKTFGGTDGSSINLTKDGKLQLKEWETAKNCSESISKMLTNPNDPNRDTHQLLAKVGNDLHYVAMGEVIPTNAIAEVDDVSIAKTTNDDGKEVLSLYGFGNGGTETNPYIPSEIDGLLSWKSVISFFNENMFDLNEGKIILKGLDGDDEEIRILTVKGGDNGAAITSDSMKTFIDPPLEWRDNKITVSGYDVAKEGEYLCRSKTGVEWKTVDDGILADEKSITTNSTPKAFALAGFGTAIENMIPFKDSTKLNWQKINDFLDTAVDEKSIALNSEEKLEVKGASSVNSPRKYFGSSTTSSLIGWWDLPNVTTNRVDVDEITLTTDNTADGKVKTIRWKSTPPSAPSLAMMGGNGIEWVPYDGVTNQNAIGGVDDISVATNDNGKLEIKGWSNQDACNADLSKMLTDEGDSDRANHEILCRVGGQIHYLPLSNGVINVPKVDGDTLIEKGDGTIGLAGSYGVEPGTVPHRTENGLEWKKVGTPDITADEPLSVDEESDGSLKLKINEDYLEELKCKCDLHNRPVADETTIFENEDGVWSVGKDFVRASSMTNAIDEAINEAVLKPDGITIIENEDDGTISLVGSYDAEPNTMLVKDEESNYVWLPIDQFKNDINIDGDTIVWKGDDIIGLAESWNAAPGTVPTRTDTGLTWIAPQTMEVLTDIEWDDATKTFKKTYKTIEFYGKVVETE